MPIHTPKIHSLIDALDLAPGEIEVDWILVFEEACEEHWWNRWLRPGFRHVSAVRWDGFNWIFVAPLLGYTKVEILPFAFHQRPESWWKPSSGRATFLHVRRRIQTMDWRAPHVVGPITCVEACKSLLGIRKFAILTPYQLYLYLRGSYDG